MIVVSDASPIINLARIGRLEILPAVFDKIIVPALVFEEVVVQGSGLPGAAFIANAVWIEVRNCSDQSLFQQLRRSLDPGESEAIVLAIELNADIVLLDDEAARVAAQSLGIEYTGLLGVLIRAKKMGLIEFVKPIVDALISQAKFHISGAVYDKVLSLAGE